MKKRIATAWLDGCSGCHMSILDMDEKLMELSARFDLVYSPIVDIKEFPKNVDVTLVEGSVNNTRNEEQARLIRDRTRILVALGDCAVTGNVPSMRNSFPVKEVLQRAYIETTQLAPKIPDKDVPTLLTQAQPLHAVVNVDLFVPGCPPSAEAIQFVLTELLEDRIPDITALTRFGK